jgi:hypothetical protein
MPITSVFTITNVAGSGTVATYTGSITSGSTPLVSGTPIIVVGLAHTLFNGTFVIAGGNLTTTFTAANANSLSSAADSGTGTVNPEGIQSYPSADVPNPLGFGALRIPTPYTIFPYGNYTPGTIIGGSQPIIDV